MEDVITVDKYKGFTITVSRVGPMMHATIELDGHTIYNRALITVDMAINSAKDFIDRIPRVEDKDEEE